MFFLVVQRTGILLGRLVIRVIERSFYRTKNRVASDAFDYTAY